MTKDEKNSITGAVWLSNYEDKYKLVLLRISYFLRLPEGYADLGQSKLARYCNCSERHVRRLQTKLEADGVLCTQLVNEKTWHNRYTLSLAALMARQSAADVIRSREDVIKSGKDQSGSGSQESTDRSATPGLLKSATPGPVRSEDGVCSNALTEQVKPANTMLPQAEAKPEPAPKAEPTPDEIRAAKIAHFLSMPQCKCEANSPFCTKCYAKPSVEDEIGAIA
jgi:hypothetical protein